MKPYIIDIDRTMPVGEAVGNYGDYQWAKGFLIGHISGLCLGGILIWAAKRARLAPFF
jgi:hypothetical protein